ncbi:MAG: hypothetical protein AAFY71_06030 [Bacteroidota bacterium]
MSMKWVVVVLILLTSGLLACEEAAPFARKYGYHRIDTPEVEERSYQVFDEASCPFTFEFPSYGKISRTSSDSCWADIQMEPFNLKWHITYRNVYETQKDLNTHFEEYRKLVYKHTKKATRIQENPIQGPTGKGTIFEIAGNVGTPAQVFYADTINSQVMIMSLYFRTALKNDSLAPVISYMKEEVSHAVQTLRWK